MEAALRNDDVVGNLQPKTLLFSKISSAMVVALEEFVKVEFERNFRFNEFPVKW